MTTAKAGKVKAVKAHPLRQVRPIMAWAAVCDKFREGISPSQLYRTKADAERGKIDVCCRVIRVEIRPVERRGK
jgi:hypothetical protein